MKKRLAEARRLWCDRSGWSADQDGLASGLVSGDVAGDVSGEVIGATVVVGLLPELEQAPTANAAARISRASKDLTVMSSCLGGHDTVGGGACGRRCWGRCRRCSPLTNRRRRKRPDRAG